MSPFVKGVHPGVMGIHSGKHGRPGGDAGGAAGESLGKVNGFRSKFIQTGSDHMVMAPPADGIAPLLIRHYENDIRF
jgi:hypothetical protein